MNRQIIAETIYEYLLTKIPNLKTWFYQLGLEKNVGLILTSVSNQSLIKYFDNSIEASYELRYLMTKDMHNEQVSIMEKIIAELCSEDFKNLMFDGKKMITYYLNTLPTPNKNLITARLENYNEIQQMYVLDLDIIIKI